MRFLVIALALMLGTGPALAGNESRLVAEGQAALEINKHETARALFERALVANPKSVEALVGLGRAHFVQEHKTAASKFYNTALAINPDSLEALLGAGLADLSLDRKDEAKKRQERLLRLCGAECTEYRELREAVLAYEPQQEARVKQSEAAE